MIKKIKETKMEEKARKAKVVAFVNQKGGVAKTTSAWNFGVELAIRGKDVCLIDMDPQGSLTFLSLVSLNEQSKTVAEWLGIRGEAVAFDEVVCRDIQKDVKISAAAKKVVGKLDLVPADISFSAAERLLQGKVGGEKILDRKIKEILNKYDYIVLDAQPSLGLLTINVLVAAQEIIIPTKPELVSAEGLNLLFGTMGDIQEAYDKEFEVGGLLMTMVKARTVGFQQVKEILKELVGALDIRIYEQFIHDSVVASDSAGSGLAVSQFKKDSLVGKDYSGWVDEYLSK